MGARAEAKKKEEEDVRKKARKSFEGGVNTGQLQAVADGAAKNEAGTSKDPAKELKKELQAARNELAVAIAVATKLRQDLEAAKEDNDKLRVSSLMKSAMRKKVAALT